METSKSFKDLTMWQRAHHLTLKTYRYSRTFPREELFGLTSQLRRAAVSVGANIAGGVAKKSPRDKMRFYNIAQGSLAEVRYYLILARDLNYGDNIELEDLATEVSKLITA